MHHKPAKRIRASGSHSAKYSFLKNPGLMFLDLIVLPQRKKPKTPQTLRITGRALLNAYGVIGYLIS
jgi:hypothetical protein